MYTICIHINMIISAMQRKPHKKINIYDRLRHQIVSMEIFPGSSLDENMLVKQFGVSRTPVREALIRLSAEGLVDIRKNRGAVVTTLDMRSLQSIFEASDLIEKAFTRLACARRSQQDLDEIEIIKNQFEKDLANKNLSAMVDSNSRFHLRIAQASGNKYLTDSYRRILADHERIAQIWYGNNLIQENDQSSIQIKQQHQALFEALKMSDSNEAEKITIAHADLCKEGVRSTLISGESIVSDIEIEANPI